MVGPAALGYASHDINGQSAHLKRVALRMVLKWRSVLIAAHTCPQGFLAYDKRYCGKQLAAYSMPPLVSPFPIHSVEWVSKRGARSLLYLCRGAHARAKQLEGHALLCLRRGAHARAKQLEGGRPTLQNWRATNPKTVERPSHVRRDDGTFLRRFASGLIGTPCRRHNNQSISSGLHY